MMQIYTVYVCKHVVPSTHNPSPPASVCLLLLREMITNMHNVVVPLIDNPTAIRDSPRDLCLFTARWKTRTGCTCVCVQLRAKLNLSRCYKCIRAVIRLHTRHTAGKWLWINQIGDVYSGCVFVFWLQILEQKFENTRAVVVVFFKAFISIHELKEKAGDILHFLLNQHSEHKKTKTYNVLVHLSTLPYQLLVN